jgi:hypothetical protein
LPPVAGAARDNFSTRFRQIDEVSAVVIISGIMLIALDRNQSIKSASAAIEQSEVKYRVVTRSRHAVHD